MIPHRRYYHYERAFRSFYTEERGTEVTVGELREHIKDMPDDLVVVWSDSGVYYDMSLPIAREIDNYCRDDEPEYHSKKGKTQCLVF